MSSRRRLLRRGLGVAVVLVAFVVVLPLLADYGDVWGEVKDLDAEALGALPRHDREPGDVRAAADIADAGYQLRARVRLARRGEVGWKADAVVAFRATTAALLARRWHVLTIATLAGQLTVFGVLLASLRTLGVSGGDVSLVEAFAAWSLVRLLGSLPITPGGVGVVEVGLTTLLVGFGGSDAEVVAAVLVYRFLTVVPTLLLGLALGPTVRTRTMRA